MECFTKTKVLNLPADAIQNIRKIHNLDTPDRLSEAIDILEEFIQKENHILKKDFSRPYLEKTLISCKGSVEKSKKQIDRLCTMKTMMPQFFSNTDVKSLENLFEIGSAVPLSKVTKDYYRVIFIKFTEKPFTAENFMEYFQYMIMLCEYMKAYDYVNGFIVVYDFRKINLLDILSKMNTLELHNVMKILMEGYGARLQCIHMITESKAIEMMIKIVKQFVSEKIGNRMQVYANEEELCKVFPQELLPADYGGKERSFKEIHDDLVEELSSKKFVEYLKMMFNCKTDESRRNKAKFNEEYMGMPGAFRNLSVD